MTDKQLLAIAKKSSMKCDTCHCRCRTLDGRPICGNGKFDPRITTDGRTLCERCAKKEVAAGTAVLWEIPEWTEPDRVTDFGEKFDFVSDLEVGTHFTAYAGNNVHRKCRVYKDEDEKIFVFSPGKRKYGRYFCIEEFCEKFDVCISMKRPETEDEKWRKNISCAIKRLTSSGLWPEMLAKLKNLNKMTLEDKRLLYRLNWDIRDVDDKAYDEWKQKYPFVFYKSNSGETCIDTFYIYEMSNVKLKSMYFGKYQNEDVKAKIKAKLSAKERFSTTNRASYDVSFSYDPDKNAAWYSEEYRGCGNGHYYIAIDHSMAWFCEDD